MKVYVAEVCWHYEGCAVLGIFDTEEKALRVGAERRVIPGSLPRGDELIVTEWEVE